jgi:glycosyl transferase, family 25
LASFRQVNAHLNNVHVFRAIDGISLSREDLAARGLIVPPIRYTEGAPGNMMSHVMLWESVAASGEVTTICEDDAIFNQGFERRAAYLLSVLPDDMDIIYWGWNLNSHTLIVPIPGMSPCLTWFGRDPLPQETAAFQAARISALPLRLLSAFGILCYTITPQGARNLRQGCLPVVDDVYFFLFSRNWTKNSQLRV